MKRGMGSSSPFNALYNLETDVAEQNNVLKDYPEISEHLLRYVKVFEEELANNSRSAGIVENSIQLTTN